MDDLIECHVCGTMNKDFHTICSDCGTDLSVNDSEYVVENDEGCCLNCAEFKMMDDIQCPVLAKKWDRDRIEIDCPDSMHCGNYRSIK